VTSRSESKRVDDSGVDLCYTGGYAVQCKNMESIRPSPHEILYKKMPQNDKVNLLFHKKNRKGVVVSMREEDFWKIIEEL
jgi:hypothetical protein